MIILLVALGCLFAGLTFGYGFGLIKISKEIDYLDDELYRVVLHKDNLEEIIKEKNREIAALRGDNNGSY